MNSEEMTPAIIFSTLAEKKAVKKAKEYTDAAIAALPNGLVYKGAVAYFDNLPTSQVEIGDCYTVKYKGSTGTEADGTEYAWGTFEGVNQWIPVGPDITGKADKVKNAVSDNLAALDADGNIKDSGVPKNDIANAVSYSAQTGKTDAEKTQARENIEAEHKHPYISLRRIDSYLYEATFQALAPEIDLDVVTGGMCSSYVQGGKLYSNLDWNYAETASFHIICPGFEGMAFLGSLTDTQLDDRLIGQLPYHIRDGRNENGIMVATHILYNDWDAHGSGEIPLTKLPYIALTRIKSMATIEDDLDGVLDNLHTTPAMDAAEYLIQVIVSDGTTTCVLRPGNSSAGTYEIVDITANPKLTNFRWVSNPTVARTNLQNRPTGVERWNEMPEALSDLRFTKAYESPIRLSEFIGINHTTKDSTDAELTEIYNTAHDLYEQRSRDGSTWQTMHSVIYSPHGIEHLWVQEDWSRDYVGIAGVPTKLSDLESDSLHRTVTDAEKTAWNGKAEKDTEAEKGNVAIFDIDGNPSDSGYKYAPEQKTASMKQSVGVDTEGKLWVETDSGKPRFGVTGVGKSPTTLTRIWDSTGFTATPSTDAAAGHSDFDSFKPFNRNKCVGSWALVGDKAVFTPQAYYGDVDYAEDGTMGDYVAIDVTPFFWYHDNNSGTFAVSEGWHSGWEYHPVCLDADGKPREHTYLPAYELGMVNGKPVSLPGCHPEFGAYKALWDKCRLYGDGGNIKNKCIMEPSDVNHYNWLLMTIEFTTTNMRAIMQGATSMRYSSDAVQLSGTDVNSVVLTSSVGDAYVVGQSIYLGSAHSDTPSSVAAYNVVTAIEKCDSDGTLNPSGTYRKITFDGTPRTVTAASTKIGSRPWITGSTNSVLGHTGSPVSNTDSKHPCKYRWLENPYGSINKTCIDLMDARVEDGDSFKLRWYYNSEYKHNGATATSNPSSESAFTEAAGWHLLSVETDKEHYVNGYIKELSADADYPTVFVPTNTTGGSATTYYADYAYLVHSHAVRAVRRGGDLAFGASYGPCYFYADSAPSSSHWTYGAGLFFAQ